MYDIGNCVGTLGDSLYGVFEVYGDRLYYVWEVYGDPSWGQLCEVCEVYGEPMGPYGVVYMNFVECIATMGVVGCCLYEVRQEYAYGDLRGPWVSFI